MAFVPSCAEGDHQRAVHSRRICHTRHPSPSCQRQATISNAQSGLLLRAPIDRLSAEDTSLAPTTQPIISIGIGSTVSSAVGWLDLPAALVALLHGRVLEESVERQRARAPDLPRAHTLRHARHDNRSGSFRRQGFSQQASRDVTRHQNLSALFVLVATGVCKRARLCCVRTSLAKFG